MSDGAPEPGYIYIWEYSVRRDKVDEFERVYGPSGPWVKLFSGAAGYVRTELHRDRVQPLRYVTIDYWESAGSWESFRAGNSVEFDALDARCEELTLEEREIGRFENPGRA